MPVTGGQETHINQYLLVQSEITINLSANKNYLLCGVIMSDNIFINHLNHIHGNFLTDLHVKITLMNNFACPATRRLHEQNIVLV